MRNPVLHFILIIIVGFLVYSNTFRVPFQWDGIEYIVRNPIIIDLGYFANPSLAESFPVYYGLIMRFIGYLTFALNYRLHGFDVSGYHIFNILVHLINAVTVYYFVCLTFRTSCLGSTNQNPDLSTVKLPTTNHGSRYIALLTALLFVTHPIQTEAVTYIFQRFTSLSVLFFLLSITLYVKGRITAIKTTAFSFYLLSLLSGIAAMKTKENTFTLPMMIILYELIFFKGPLGRRTLRMLPFILLLPIIPVTFLVLVGSTAELTTNLAAPVSHGYHDLSSGEYLITQFVVIIRYIRLTLLPVGQNLIHHVPPYRSLYDPAVGASLAFHIMLLCISGYLLHLSRMKVRSSDYTDTQLQRLTAFGIFWFYVTISIESSFIPLPTVMDEYRVYLPSVGLFLALTSCFCMIMRKLSVTSVWKKRTAVALFCAVILSLSYATYARNSLWSDKITLWQDVARKNPFSELGLNNLGTAYYEKGLYNRAIEQFRKVIELNPVYASAYINLGSAYATTGRPDLAARYFQKATSLDPENYLAHANLARSYREKGSYEMAVKHYAAAIALYPFHRASYLGLGDSLEALGRDNEAFSVYSRFIRLIPNDAELYLKRGILYEKKGDINSAVKDFERSCSLGNMISCEYAKWKDAH